MRKLGRQDRQTLEFIRWLEGGEPYLTVTFDQETALEQRDIPFITPVHPLTKIAISYWNLSEGSLFTYLEVEDKDAEPGSYAFAYYLWETISLHSEVRLLPMAWNLKEEKIADAISQKLSRLLKLSSPGTTPLSLPQKQIEHVLHNLEEVIHEERSKEVEKLRKTNYQLAEQQLATLERYYQRRFARVEEELASATDDRIRRMKESEQAGIQREWEHKKQDIEERKKADIISRRIAYGIMEVKQSEHN